MAYSITRANASLQPFPISDGAINTNDTSLTLIGKNTTGYGEAFNTNFVRLLENFANASPPINTISGQLWYDTDSKILKVYEDTTDSWKNIGTVTAGNTTPSTDTVGDTFFKEDAGALYVYDGVSTDLAGGWKLIGPQSTSTFGISTAGEGPTSVTKIITGLTGSTTVTAVLSDQYISTVVGSDISSLFPSLNAGLNIRGDLVLRSNSSVGTLSSTYYSGTAENANKLGNITATSYALAGSGNVTSLTGVVLLNDTIYTKNILPIDTANAYTIGNTTHWYSTVYAQASQALYADLAERFSADAVYTPGTVVRIGGSAEVTQENEELSSEVLGVVSTNPAFLMNAGSAEAPALVGTDGVDQTLQGYDGSGGSTLNPPIVIGGRAPVRTIGTVAKGQRLVSAGNGVARGAVSSEITAFNVIGRSLEDKTISEESSVMAIIKINT